MSTNTNTNTNLKIVLFAVALAALVAAPAVAKSRTQQHAATDIYQSYSLGHQSYPNPDRGPYPTPVPAWVNG
jgi:hypothetical protein